MTKRERLQELLKQTSDILSHEEFLAAFKAVTEQLKKYEADLNTKIDAKTQSAVDTLTKLAQEYEDAISKVQSESKTTLSGLKNWAIEQVTTLFIKNKINEQVSAKLQEVDSKLAQIKNGTDGKDGSSTDITLLVEQASALVLSQVKPLIPSIEQFSNEIPKYGEQIRDSLELLPEGEKLKIDAIEDLQKQLDEIKKSVMTKQVTYGGGGGANNLRPVYIYSLSTQLNGVLKTFPLPAFLRVLNVHSTSFPNSAFEPLTDYTTDANASTITFTSQVNASTTLAAGQTLLIELIV